MQCWCCRSDAAGSRTAPWLFKNCLIGRTELIDRDRETVPSGFSKIALPLRTATSSASTRNLPLASTHSRAATAGPERRDQEKQRNACTAKKMADRPCMTWMNTPQSREPISPLL